MKKIFLLILTITFVIAITCHFLCIKNNEGGRADSDTKPVNIIKEKDLEFVRLTESSATLLFEERCGVQDDYGIAYIFSFISRENLPDAWKKGCWKRVQDNYFISIFESNGISIGEQIVRFSVKKLSLPNLLYMPIDNDPRNLRPVFFAVGQFETDDPAHPDFFGLTNQVCPFLKEWFIVRRVLHFPAEPYEGCWNKNSDYIEVRLLTYGNDGPFLDPDSSEYKKSSFYKFDLLNGVPEKYF